MVPEIYLAFMGTSIQGVWIPLAILGLLMGLLTLPLAIMARPRKSWLPALMAFIFVAFMVVGHLTSDHSDTRPLRNGIYYALSADEGKAYWNGLLGTEIDAWTEQFLAKGGVKGDYRNVFPWEHEALSYQASAPVVNLPLPRVEQLATVGSEGFRLHVVPPPGATAIDLFTLPGPVTGVIYSVGGKPIESDGLLIYTAPPAEGFDVLVEAPGQDSLKLRVVSISSGLPALPGFNYAPRPAWIIPVSEDATDAAKTFVFEKE
jgi:hypothetical protein